MAQTTNILKTALLDVLFNLETSSAKGQEDLQELIKLIKTARIKNDAKGREQVCYWLFLVDHAIPDVRTQLAAVLDENSEFMRKYIKREPTESDQPSGPSYK